MINDLAVFLDQLELINSFKKWTKSWSTFGTMIPVWNGTIALFVASVLFRIKKRNHSVFFSILELAKKFKYFFANFQELTFYKTWIFMCSQTLKWWKETKRQGFYFSLQSSTSIKNHFHITFETASNLNKIRLFCFFAEFQTFRISNQSDSR